MPTDHDSIPGDEPLVKQAEFWAEALHDLRTPLNPILGLSELLLEEKNDPDAVASYAGVINKAASEMLGLMDKIADYNRLFRPAKAGKLTVFTMGELFDELRDEFSIEARNKRLQFETQLSDTVADKRIKADQTTIRTVAANLLENAIKFTDSGKIAMKGILEGGESRQQRVTCTIVDSGIGIEPGDRDRIWGPFKTGSLCAGSGNRGRGLGLFICRSYLDKLSGTISFTSNPGKGSTFTFSVPVELP